MQKGQLSQESDIIAEAGPYKNYESLPLADTGCDSYASWHPKFKDLSPFKHIDDLVDEILELLPYKKWMDEHLVITGGEPLLGWQKAYPILLDHPKMGELKNITFETNGTQPLSTEFRNSLLQWNQQRFPHGNGGDITFSVSAKLSCSGESRDDAIKPSIVCSYQEIGYTYLKFVVATEDDVEEALETVDIYRAEGFEGPVYLMPVGGVNEVYNLNARRVAELALKNGLRYSDRLHLPLFGNSWGT
jgi:organic radical activating enzyme